MFIFNTSVFLIAIIYKRKKIKFKMLFILMAQYEKSLNLKGLVVFNKNTPTLVLIFFEIINI